MSGPPSSRLVNRALICLRSQLDDVLFCWGCDPEHFLQVASPQFNHLTLLMHVRRVIVMLAGNAARFGSFVIEEEADKLIRVSCVS